MLNHDIHVTSPVLPELKEYIAEIEPIWNTRILTHTGPKHQALEKELCKFLYVQQISLFTNGHLALEAALSILTPSSEVITTPFTFVSTTQAIIRAGLIPVFCDINPKTYTIDPNKIEELITNKTSAILPVHVYGNLCNNNALTAIAQKHGLMLIYDAAHAFGMESDGENVAGFGDITMFSFHATKVFHTIEGGALCYKDADLYKHFAAWRQFGMYGKEDAEIIGTNAKMNEFQAAMGLCNLRHVESAISKRKAISALYKEHLGGVPGIKLCKEKEGVKYNYAYFPVLFDPAEFGSSRDDVLVRLSNHNIFARKYFFPLTFDFSVCKNHNYVGEAPIARRISENILTLPLYPDLEPGHVERICEIVKAK